nr:DUF2345 domain-containing protein [Hafnia alvei]
MTALFLASFSSINGRTISVNNHKHLKTGGDPRTFADYAALRDELSKLSHPARPDVNWSYAEKLCLSLFEHNGVELQTAAWYTQAKGQGAMLEMAPAVNRIKQANREMQALNNAAEAAKALVSDIRTQNNLVTQSIADLQSAVMLASAPQGMAFTSGEHLQLTSSQNTMLNAGQHLDIGAMGNVSLSAEQELGLFVHKVGAKLIANLGEVEMHSRHNTLDMSAQKQLTITSTDDEIIISTPKTLTVNGGGSYLKLSDSGIEHGSKGDLTMKVGEYLVPGSGGDMPFDAPNFKTTEIAEMTNIISKPLSN